MLIKKMECNNRILQGMNVVIHLLGAGLARIENNE